MMLAATLGLAGVGAPARAQDAERGRTLFVQCAACHTVIERSGPDGPSLVGIIGRPAGSLSDFRYSRPMARAGLVWDDVYLDSYLANPQAVVPCTRMAFSGVPAAADRADLIAYLKSLK